MHICVQKQVEKRKERFANWSSEFSLNNLDQEFSLDDKGLQPGVAAQPCESFRRSLKRYKEHITAPNLPQPAPDTHHNDLPKQGFSANQERNSCQPYDIKFRNKVNFNIQPTNPQADTDCTGRCEYWITNVDLAHEAPRKRHRIPLRQPYTPEGSVHCHGSLHLQRRREMQRHAHPWAPQHSTKGF